MLLKGDKIMKAIFDVIKYNGENSTLVYRYPKEDFNTLSQLIVQQSQEAIFYSRGQLADCFSAGTYTLSTKNIPILSNLINLPFGKESPFSAVIYFVNKTEQFNIKWGLPKVSFTEPEFGAILNVGAFGTLTFKVDDAKVFLSKLVGQKTSFTQDEIMVLMKEFVISRGRNRLANIFNTRADFDILTIETQLNYLADTLKEELSVDFREYGLRLEKLLVSGVNKDEESTAYKQILQRRQQRLEIESINLEMERRKALQTGELDLLRQEQFVQQDIAARGKIIDSQAEAIKRKQEGYTYQQERGFDVAEKTAENEGVGNFASAGMGIGIGVGAAGAAATSVGTMYNDALSAITNMSTTETSEKTMSADVFNGIGLDNIGEQKVTVETVATNVKSKKERLLELKELYEMELITEQEFEVRKAEILSEI